MGTKSFIGRIEGEASTGDRAPEKKTAIYRAPGLSESGSVASQSRVKTDHSSGQDLILDAVQVCVRTYGVRRFTISDVANVAGVSRRTVYDRFKDKDDLMKGFLMRLVNALGRIASKQIQRNADPEVGLSAATYFFLRYTLSRPVMRNPLVRREFLDFIADHAQTLVRGGTSVIAHILRDNFELSPAGARLAAEHAVRILASYVLLPTERLDRYDLARSIAVGVLAVAHSA